VSEGPDRNRRLERMLEESREWATRAGSEVADTLARAWREVFGDHDASSGSATDEQPARPGVDDLEAGDPSELFDTERRRELERLGHANILIIGQTGVGKSTLINAVFRKPLAQASMGRPVTKVIERFEDPDVPVTLYDSRGVELGDSKDRIIKDFKKTIAKSRKARPEHHIHLLWYCMDAGQTRVQDYDLEIIQALAEEVPVLVVFTQTIDDERADALEKALVDAQAPIEGRPIRTLATERRIGRQTLKPVGLEELVRATNDVLPEAVKRAFINAQGVVLDLKVDNSRLVVLSSPRRARRPRRPLQHPSPPLTLSCSSRFRSE
jgi:GTP-binding protein EngB required for normal cell division